MLNFVQVGFEMEKKVKTLDFSGNLKVGTYIIELMKSYSIRGQGHLLTLVKGHLHIRFKTYFSREQFLKSKPNFICDILRKEKSKFV